MSTTTVPEPPTTLTLPPQQAARLLTTFTHFLTVSIHNILFYRGLYPEPTFLTSRAYNLPVHQSRHPAVCAWIRDAVDAASVQLAAGAVERLAVVIYGPESVPGTGTKDPESKGSASSTGGSSSNGKGAGVIKVLERWMFDVAGFPTWKKSSKDKKGKGKEVERDRERELAEDEPEEEDALEGGEEAATKINWTNIDEQLRAAIRRLAYAGEKIAALPEGCTFTVAVELRNEAEAPIGVR
ncbi:DNA-binding protein [Xylariaceae sp. FL0255]|nr:DNA-binding protein [Xylariaceae sp. FL0255]